MSRERPAILILNAGIVHRIGPGRNTVELARRLAEEGFLVLRFDLTGIGDSDNRRDGTAETNAVVDTRQAMDWLEKNRGVKTFVLMGLCSGADFSFATACEDARVVGAVLMDGYGYRTRKFHVVHYAQRVLAFRQNPGALRRLAVRIAQRVYGSVSRRLKQLPEAQPHSDEDDAIGFEAPAGDVMNQWQRPFPPREEFARDLAKLVDRQLKLLFIYTRGIEEYYNYEDQLADSVPEVDVRGRIDVVRFATSDHTMTELESKARLLSTTVSWFRRRFPASTTQPAVGATSSSPG